VCGACRQQGERLARCGGSPAQPYNEIGPAEPEAVRCQVTNASNSANRGTLFRAAARGADKPASVRDHRQNPGSYAGAKSFSVAVTLLHIWPPGCP
jgi:hypothetical protein